MGWRENVEAGIQQEIRACPECGSPMDPRVRWETTEDGKMERYTVRWRCRCGHAEPLARSKLYPVEQ